MEWTTLQHLDLRHVGRGVRPLQPHAATFHPHQALVAVAIGTYIVGEQLHHHSLPFSIIFSFLFDSGTLVHSGCKIWSRISSMFRIATCLCCD